MTETLMPPGFGEDDDNNNERRKREVFVQPIGEIAVEGFNVDAFIEQVFFEEEQGNG